MRQSPRSALLILDWQKFFVDRSSKAYIRGSLKLHLKLRAITEYFLDRNKPVFASRHFGEEWPEDPFYNFYGRILKKDDDLFQLDEPLRSIAGIKVYDKKTYSLFENEKFLHKLKTCGTRKIYLAGLQTDKCVLANSFSAFDKSFEVIVIEDCVIARDKKSHSEALSIIRKCCGRVVTSGFVMGALQ
jgi:nicotinamidase-related amidase